MRKLTATVLFALLVTTSAFAAAPRNESKDTPGPVTRVVEKIKSIIVHILDEPVVGTPTPLAPSNP